MMDGIKQIFSSLSPNSKSRFKIQRLSDAASQQTNNIEGSNEKPSTSKLRRSNKTNAHEFYDAQEPGSSNFNDSGYSDGYELYDMCNLKIFPLRQLPEDILLHVFRYLDQNDRLRVSSVCKSWRQLVFSSPRLWRRRQLTLRCSRHSAHSRRACLYARRLGKYLHKLSVTCEHPNNHACRSMAVCFQKLLTSLKQPTSLLSFKVTDLRLRYTRASVLQNISQSLEKMLLSLRRLKTFEMSDAHWPSDEGLRVIRSVLGDSNGSKNTLQTLRIDGFFVPRFVPSEATDVLSRGLGTLTHLTKLSIDYFYLSDETVASLAVSRQGQLRSLKLVACDVSPHSRFISKFSWLALTTACPSLRVEFCVQGFTVSPATSLPLLLSSALRVNKIKLAIGAQYTFLDMARLNMAAVLSHITKHYRRRLIRFEMDIDNHNDAIDTALIRMVRKCRNLVSVKVTAYFNNADTDVIVRDIVRARRDKHTVGPFLTMEGIPLDEGRTDGDDAAPQGERVTGQVGGGDGGAGSARTDRDRLILDGHAADQISNDASLNPIFDIRVVEPGNAPLGVNLDQNENMDQQALPNVSLYVFANENVVDNRVVTPREVSQNNVDGSVEVPNVVVEGIAGPSRQATHSNRERPGTSGSRRIEPRGSNIRDRLRGAVGNISNKGSLKQV